jgi:hypothetical protein
LGFVELHGVQRHQLQRLAGRVDQVIERPDTIKKRFHLCLVRRVDHLAFSAAPERSERVV